MNKKLFIGLLCVGSLAVGAAHAASTNTVRKIFSTSDVKSISPNFTDAECQKIIPKHYAVDLEKGKSPHAFKLSDSLTLSGHHPVLGKSKQVFDKYGVSMGNAHITMPTGDKKTYPEVAVIEPVSSSNSAVGFQGVFIIDHACKAHIEGKRVDNSVK